MQSTELTGFLLIAFGVNIFAWTFHGIHDSYKNRYKAEFAEDLDEFAGNILEATVNDASQDSTVQRLLTPALILRDQHEYFMDLTSRIIRFIAALSTCAIVVILYVGFKICEEAIPHFYLLCIIHIVPVPAMWLTCRTVHQHHLRILRKLKKDNNLQNQLKKWIDRMKSQ